jgi:hypothetical protein
VIPYLHRVAFRFDNELVAYFEEDDFDEDLLVWVNEYTDGYFGRQFNQFADAYFDFGQNIYRKQHGLDFWPDRYHQKFDLWNASPAGKQKALSLAMAANPQRDYISAALDYSTPCFEASFGYTYKPVDAAPDLSALGLNYSAEHVFNSRLSWGPQLLRFNVDIALAGGKWSLGGESSNSLYGLMNAYDLTSLLPDDELVPLLLQIPVLPFVGASLSSRIPLPADSHVGFDVAWRPQLENYGHEHDFLKSISWDNFLATFYLDRKVARGLSYRLEVFTRINHLFSLQPQTPTEMSVSKVNALVGINL